MPGATCATATAAPPSAWSSCTGASNCFTGSATTSFGVDVQGNLAWKNQQNFKFSLDNRLRESVGVATYRYDGQGRRVSANNPTAGGDLSWMYSVDGKLRRMTDARRMKVQHYMYLGGSLVAIREQDFGGNLLGIKYQHTDALGSPVAVTDAATNVIERSEYEPYGKLLNRPINDAPGFTGHVQDADTGLTYMQQRYYDPQVGRFLSIDPVTANSATGENFNRYWYANNNPHRFTDPDGRQACSDACLKLRAASDRVGGHFSGFTNNQLQLTVNHINRISEATPHQSQQQALNYFGVIATALQRVAGREVGGNLEQRGISDWRALDFHFDRGPDAKTSVTTMPYSGSHR